jgi:hypothetical protein
MASLPFKVDMVHSARRDQPQTCRNKHRPHSRTITNVSALHIGHSNIAPSARVLDRRAPGRPDHGALPSWRHKVSGLLRAFGSISKLTPDPQANGVDMLRKAGIQVILDHHALPGAQAKNQMFAGKCVISL